MVVYAKLPGGFTIPTPVGSYNPDWAIAFQEGKVKHLYFVAETKGTLEEMKLKGIEKAKIECAGKFFSALGTKGVQYHVTYREVATYTDLMNMANSESTNNNVYVYTPRLLNNLLVRNAVSSWYNVSMELRLDENGCPLDRTLLIGRAFVHFKGKRYQLLVPGDEEGEVRRHGKRSG